MTNNPIGRLLAKLTLRAIRLLPPSRALDRIYSYALFYLSHRRWPASTNGALNDAVFSLRISKELENPLRVFITDKEYVKTYVTARAGKEFIIPTIKVLNSRTAALAYEYPENCIIKPTHLSGHVIRRQNNSAIDLSVISAWFDESHYRQERERNYLGLRPKVIVEEFAHGRANPSEFLIFCWNGVPKVIEHIANASSKITSAYYTTDWQYLSITHGLPLERLEPPIEAPQSLPLMLDLARKISADFSLIRVDFYTHGQNVVVGELTNLHGGAKERFTPPDGDGAIAKICFGPGGWQSRHRAKLL